MVTINGKPYVGKDHQIYQKKRIREHYNMLKRNAHWSNLMQEDFNNKGFFESSILWETESDISDEELCELEKYFIAKIDSKNNGYNQTDGGIGGLGYKYTPEQLEGKSIRVSDDKNPMAKLNLSEFLSIVDMLEAGFRNADIASRFDLHDRYISLIRNKRRHKRWFAEYAPDYEIVSAEKFRMSRNKLSEQDARDIFLMCHRDGMTNAELGRKYKVNPSTISNIRTRKTFKEATKDLTV